MALSKEVILTTAEEFIAKRGFEATTLSDIAKKLGVSHAALYKYYKNKEQLFENLAKLWLEQSMKEIFDYPAMDSLHDWLWLVATTKKQMYQTDAKMFLLYTKYIEGNQKLVTEHLKKLAEKAEQIDNKKNGQAVITAFTFFHNPYFAERWDKESYQAEFEQVWRLIESKRQEKL